jgi:hypothetical protein
MTLDKREQVFVSSTHADLIEERQAIIMALLRMDCFPAGMEFFPASHEEKWSLIKKVIEDSDYYIVVIGGRYGSLHQDGVSFTEKEFDYAEEIGKPILAFIHREPDLIPAGKTELDPASRIKLEAFREKAGQRMADFWTTSPELAGNVIVGLIAARKTHPAEGWIRASNALTPEIEREISDLQANVATLTNEKDAATRRAVITDLAQGEDLFPIQATIEYWTQEDLDKHHDDPWSARKSKMSIDMSWDDIFGALSPSLIDESGEVGMKNSLSRAIREHAPTPFPSPAGAAKLGELLATVTAVDDVKVQLFSLGLIKQC